MPSNVSLGPLEETNVLGMPETKPSWWPGSKAELYVFIVLTRLKAEFTYLGHLGEPHTLGSVEIDFQVFSPVQVAIRVMGEYWHYQQGAEKLAQDLIQRLELESEGWPVIYIDEDDILRNPFYYVQEALRLREHSKYSPYTMG
jgi:hypothetical protein